MAEFVRALYDYTQSNNDELSFRRGEIITVTQKLEGGWWEGTLHKETGWFPANLVELYEKSAASNGVENHQDMRPAWRKLVLNNLVESEREHLKFLQTFQRVCLHPLGDSRLLTDDEFRTFCGNFHTIVHLHATFVAHFEDILRSPSEHQSVGGVFMQMASEMRAAHVEYCGNHPSAIEVLNQNKEGLMQFCAAHGLGDQRGPIIYLTSELSRPFRRLDKYPGMLQELERHLEEFHPDRGNTQRSVKIYTEIANECTDKRRQKESELEILKGNVQDYQGPDIHSLGRIVLMSQLNIRDDSDVVAPKQERFLVLFEEGLLLLSASKRMSCFVYMAHSLLSGLKVNTVDGNTHTVEISSKSMDAKIVTFKSDEEMHLWRDAIHGQMQKLNARPPVMGKSNTLPKPTRLNVNGTSALSKLDSSRDTNPDVGHKGHHYKPPIITNPVWSGSCLRPHPPLQPDLSTTEKITSMPQSPKLPRKFSSKRKEPVRVQKREPDLSAETAKQYEEDMQLLSVVDAYCISSKTRHQVNSELLDSPHVLIPEEEKIFVEGSHGGFIEEKSLVDTVYGLKDELRQMNKEIAQLHTWLQEERRARKNLEGILHNGNHAGMNGDRPTQSLLL